MRQNLLGGVSSRPGRRFPYVNQSSFGERSARPALKSNKTPPSLTQKPGIRASEKPFRGLLFPGRSRWMRTVVGVSLALLFCGCGVNTARSSAEQASFDSSAAVHRFGAEENAGSAGEAEYLDAVAMAPAPAFPERKAKVAATDLISGDPATDADSPETVDTAGKAEPFVDEESRSAIRPLLVYQADLGLAVFRVQENLDKIEKMALGAGGYLVARGEQRITVRVPAKDFEHTVDAVLELGDVHRREITAQDVTTEYLDVQIRLKNALAMRQRLEELLHKAQDVKEALKVEEQLGRVAEQIELMKGRLKYLREVTSFSTISVEFAERSAPIDARVQLPFEWLRELGLNSLLSL